MNSRTIRSSVGLVQFLSIARWGMNKLGAVFHSIVASTSLLLILSNPANASGTNYEAAVSKAAVFIAQTTSVGTTERIDTVYVTATRIVEDMSLGDPDFNSTCGLNPDCYVFWMDSISNMLAQAIQLEDDKKARCDQARSEYAFNKCENADYNPPKDDSDIRFNMGLTGVPNYDFFRPILREFHTRIWNDETGNEINNYSAVLTAILGACDSRSLNEILAIPCKLDAWTFFGQLGFSGGVESFKNSPAGIDASRNLNGKLCVAIRVRLNADQCKWS
jgi:hypothetical protein